MEWAPWVKPEQTPQGGTTPQGGGGAGGGHNTAGVPEDKEASPIRQQD